jgi:hypothetical protein
MKPWYGGINNHEDLKDCTPEESKVIELVVSRGFKEHIVIKRIEEMKRDGTLSEPKYGLLKVV